MRRISLIVVGLLLLGLLSAGALAACGDETTETTSTAATTSESTAGTEVSDTSTTAAADTSSTTASTESTAPGETIKIGVLTYDPTDLGQVAIFKYLNEYIAPAFNVEFVISEAIADSNAQISFYENCAAQGCKGMMNLYTVTDAKVVFDKMAELEMYMVLPNGLMPDYEIELTQGNPYIVGAIGPSGDYEGFKGMTTSFLEAGARSFVVATGGKDYGIQMFIDRTQGVEDAIAEFEAANPDAEITVEEFGGFPNDPAFFATQGQMIASNPDAIIAEFAGEFLWVQPLTEAGKVGQVMLGTYTSMNEVSAAAVEGGAITYMIGTYEQQVGPGFALLYNWITGYGADFSTNGGATSIEQPLVSWQSPEDATKWMALVQADPPPYSVDDLKSVIRVFNPAATMADLTALATEGTYDDIVARRGQ